MTYKQAAEVLGNSDCVPVSENLTRIRRESPDCIALYYDGRPHLKWLSNGDIIIHNRGSMFASAAVARLKGYCPIPFSLVNETTAEWSFYPLPEWGGPLRRLTGGVRICVKHKKLIAIS